MAILADISEFLQKGRAKNVRALVSQALDEGIPAEKILEEGLLPGMSVIGDKFRDGEVFVPEVLVAARAMNAGIEVLKPLLAEAGDLSKGVAVIGTVHGDLHDIGKNLVRIMFEGKGLNVIDLGVDVTAEQFVDAAKEHNAQIIACSALLTTTMGEMRETVEEAKRQGIRDRVYIMVGGAPLTQAFCDQIGADAYAPDAASAANLALAHCTKA
ncbi:MAG: cobalamin-binding protein [Clostridiales bacterium]|jgi:corrinoid protein of di/trimethylamine methyltransferase|nr:cobalamin-binding protein [Clostridiales bacterium]